MAEVGGSTIRKFDTGATRNADNNKFDYEGFLSPLVIKEFGRYMHKHRFLSNGAIRNSDNWQNLFGENHYDVCIKSAWRHFEDWWLIHRGNNADESLEDALCGLLFNVQAYLYALLKAKQNYMEDNRP